MDIFAADPAFWMNMAIVGGMGLFFYFLIIRPQKKADKQRGNFNASLKKGSKIITIGGLYGMITALGDEKVTLKLAENVEIEVARTALARYQDDKKQEMVDSQ